MFIYPCFPPSPILCQGSKKITGLILDMHSLKEDKSEWQSMCPHWGSSSKKQKIHHLGIFVALPTQNSNEVDLKVDAFAGISNLRLLQMNDVKLCGNYKNFPKKLQWLNWSRYRLQSIPSDFPFDKMVALEMPNSGLKKVFNRTQCLVLLKILNLNHSHDLSETPNFSILPNLERLILEDCSGLVKVNESIGGLERLIFLNLRDCKKLRKLPKAICRLKSLATLDISGCSYLENLPTEFRNMGSITVLAAERTPINQILSLSLEAKPWHLFIWPRPSNLRSCPRISWGCLPQFLVHLSLVNCNLSDDSFPSEFGNLSSLQILNLSRNPICSLPNCIRDLSGLRKLLLEFCPRLQSLNGLQKKLEILRTTGSKLLKRIEFDTLYGSISLAYEHWFNLTEVVGSFKLEPLEHVDAELINNLGLCNFDTLEKPQVRLYSAMVSGKIRMFPPQGIHERHTFYTYLTGSKIPTRFNLKNFGSSVSFTMPSDVNFKIQGLSVCSIYSLPNHDARYYDLGRASWGLHLIISNATKHLKWSNCPKVFGIPGTNEHLMWLSYWKFEDQLEGGDELNISIITDLDFEIKEVGVQLVYKEAEEKKSTKSTSLEVAQRNNRYRKVVPSTNCKICDNDPMPTNPTSTRVICLGMHPKNCTGCPEGYLQKHHAVWRVPKLPIPLYS